MTMDINNSRKVEIKTEIVLPKNDEQTEIQPLPKSVKRSFDVAFLMLPDEKLKQKQARTAKLNAYNLEISKESSVYNNNDKSDSDEDIEVETNSNSPKHDFSSQKPKYFITQKQQIFDDPHITKATKLQAFQEDEFRLQKGALSISTPNEKSAFTKVSLNKDTRMSPNLSISPDLSYQNSLSPSPPINRTYQNFQQLTTNQMFKNQSLHNAYQNQFIADNFTVPTTGIDGPFLVKSNHADLLQPNLSKIRPMLAQYRPDLAYNYHQSQFQTQEMLKMAQPDLKFPPDIRNPAAALLSTLLPPSLAALSLPTQNVCAKCNITFRMTSDLVYHMRSHHKNDSADFTKKRREEKLKCPVCAESFRERHHLTRHMTAHQDKDNDDADPNMKKKAFVNFASK